MKNPTFPTIIEDCRRIKISDLKRLKYLEQNSVKYGLLQWGEENSISVIVDTVKCEMRLQYTYQQRHEINYTVALCRRPANLGFGVVWYFCCPKTNRLCRKLYLYNGCFVCRHAIPGAMYRQQTESKKIRYFSVIGAILQDRCEFKKYAKLYYNDKPTPQLKKYERWNKRMQKACQMLKGIQHL
ncbi:MAG: hypothetical protein LBT48_07385 [Prevotellaceae bacterium]|jgi:hypothetical protein|nr:hypothetical protein [Prevotellaceae bacterium]